ncbi:MAG: C25 family cysteine peptidase, partial [Candidatus Cloacimonetes bacterium]|nr:C25 family cysteine peptidase [Candidatus Cloacimonadota bacterium]
MKKLCIVLSILSLFISATFAKEIVEINGFETRSVSVNVLESYEDFTIVEILLNHYVKETIVIERQEYMSIHLPSQASLHEKSNPKLPVVAKSLMIPSDARMQAEVLIESFTEIEGQIIPSKGILPRSVNPNDVLYEFSNVYQTDAFFPNSLVQLSDPYIIREIRGISFRVTPFAVNPVQGRIRVYDRLVIKVYAHGVDTIDILDTDSSKVTKEFVDLYENHFINYHQIQSRNRNYIEEKGSMLVICHPAFLEAAQPFVDWKNQKGIKTVMVSSTAAGSTPEQIKDSIFEHLSDNPSLAFIQLIGGSSHVPTKLIPVIERYNNGNPIFEYRASDFFYVNHSGNNSYPDLFIGRFSAETVVHVQTQVERTIHYERDIEYGDWLNSAMGIAGRESGGHEGERDDQHMENIRQLFSYSSTYWSVDAIYQQDYDGNPNDEQIVSNNLNNGRALINYISHGLIDRWHFMPFAGTEFEYTNDDVNSLINDWKLPHIVSVACLVGDFTGNTPSFAETWLRATNNSTGAPTGAIATFMSSMLLPWAPPMYAQDAIAERHAIGTYKTIGGLYFNGTVAMLNVSQNDPEFTDTAKTWHIFGDASLMVRSAAPSLLSVSSNDYIDSRASFFEVSVDDPTALICLYNPDTQQIVASKYSNGSYSIMLDINDSLISADRLLLTVTAYNKITHVSEIEVVVVITQDTIITDPNIIKNKNIVVSNGAELTLSGIWIDSPLGSITVEGTGSKLKINSCNNSTNNIKSITLMSGGFFEMNDSTLKINDKLFTTSNVNYLINNSTFEVMNAPAIVVSNGSFNANNSTLFFHNKVLSINNTNSSPNIYSIATFSNCQLNINNGQIDINGINSVLQVNSSIPILFENFTLNISSGGKALFDGNNTIFNASTISMTGTSELQVLGSDFELSNTTLTMSDDAIFNISNSGEFLVNNGSRIVGSGSNNQSRININNSYFSFEEPALALQNSNSPKIGGLYITDNKSSDGNIIISLSGIINNLQSLSIVNSDIDFIEAQLLNIDNINISNDSKVNLLAGSEISAVNGNSLITVEENSNLNVEYSSVLLQQSSLNIGEGSILTLSNYSVLSILDHSNVTIQNHSQFHLKSGSEILGESVSNNLGNGSH